MRFLIFIYGKSRMKRTQLVSGKRAECHILLPKDDFSLERTVFLQFKNISGEWFIKETDCCHLKTEEFFQMGKRKSDEGIFYKLSIGRKNELSVGGKDLYIQLIRYRNDWSIYKKYKLRDCRIIKEKNIFIMMEKAINRKNSMGISYEYGKWFIEKCGNIEIYINEILLEKKQQLEFGDVICIGTIYLLFFENYIAVEAGERNIVSDYLEEVILENEIKGQEDVRKKEKREITFHRAPRVMEELKKVSLKVDAPPQVDVQEKKSIFMDIGTIMNLMFPMLGMNLFLIYGMKSEQNQAGIYVYSGLFMAVMSAVCSILWLMISRKYEKREQQKKVNKERLAYRRYLNKKSEYIKVQYERVYKVLQSRYLRADTYLDSPLLDMYLWNRNLYHKDFLMYRIGIGDVEFPMKIEFPEEVFGDEENILWREAKKIKEHYEILHQIPVLLDMGRYSQIGIITKDTIAGMELVRSIILQIALCNCYTEVKIGCIYNKNKVIQSQQWDFCRWLPHIWDANRQKRFIAGNEVEARRLFYDLLQIFKEREEVSISDKSEKILPHYILFVAEEQFLEGEMFSKYILDRGKEYGLTVVWLDSMRKKLPNTCKMVLEINGGFTGRYEIERHSQKKEKINFDYTEKNIAEKLIRSISGIKVMEIEEKAGIPEVVDFLGMYDVHTIEELHIKQRWEKNRIFESAKVLIGKKAGDEPFYLDIHERYHGPHGLLAGTTGSGKSEVLQTFILSMAVNFSPEAVCFLLIDYKGEGMSALFSELPHISGKISNLSDGQAYRAMVSIKSENKRRQRIFKECKVNNINDYTRLFNSGSVNEPIPHLLIIIDEFAELKKAEPEFMQELISVAQVGRSLGVHKGVSNQTGQEGIESTDVTIDKSAPELSVDYKGIINVMEAESSPANINKKLKSNGEKITSSGNELFMKRENSIDICIEDMNLEAENIELKLYRVKYGLNGKIEQNKESWEEITEKIKQEPEKQELEKGEQEKNSKTVMRYSVTNLDDGHYKLMIHCTDKAGNVMTAEKSSETERCIYNGYYESPLYTVDTKSPLITSVILNQNAVKKIGKRQYFQNAPQITIKIQEENFNKINFSLEGKMFYSNGMVMEKEWERFKSQEKSLQWKSYYEDGIRINETNIQVEAEGNYTLNFGVIDSAACVANQENLKITYDCHKPEIIYTGVDNESGDLIFKAEENGDDKKKNTLLLFHKYHFFRYFSKRRMNVFIRIKDAISGIERINYAFIPYEEQTIDINKFSQVERTGAEKINDEYFEKKDLSEFSITVSPEKENFKGYLKVYGQDYSGNVSEMVKSKGAISESLQLHKETSNITMKMPRAFFTDKEKNIRYYNSTVPVQAIFEDTYAGIYKTQLYAKTTKKKDSSIKTGKTIMWDGDNLIYRKRQQIELEADKFSQSDADNPLTIQADLEDNAGHTEKNILNEKVVIDNTKPEIEVVYNQNNQTQYYNFSRKATVTVKEKNFSPDLVVWNIQGSNQKYQIGEWKNVQGTYVCEISFEEDGRDYSVGLSVTDKAGNKSEWKDRNYFTIDKTVPQISIQINGIGKQADQVPYFNTERIITFCIQEQNFDKDKVEYNIDAIHGKSRITIKKPVKYQEDGDKYYSRLVLRKEAKYHIQVKCTDKAGNVSETAETKEFIIDTTTPAVHIAGVKQNGIYQGKKIMPQVICKDQYLDRESVEISLKKIDDRNVLKKEWSYERAESENTVQVQWDNIKKTENSDGIYYLQIKGQDKAGNKIKDDFKVVFRVNQRGADFILSHALKKKINKYYLKEAPKIKLREQCVKQTKSRAVILKDNEERKVIGESSITSSVIADKKSERYGWYEKYYNFAKKDFEREGDYRVTFQADTKEKELRFVVDRTPPVVHIGNLDKQIYEEKEHEFTIRVMDNYAFKELELYMETDRDILGQKGTKKIIIKPKDLDENYMVRKTLTADKRYQTVRYIARDKAGNVIDSNDNGDTKVCLVTDSKTVKEYQEHKKEYMLIGIISTLGIFIVISGSGLFIFTRRKRNLK